MISTTRTGCYKQASGQAGFKGTLTPIFLKIIKYIKEYDIVNFE
ncbi:MULTISPECIES: hypothetical protein [unclassified Clostridioides]